MSNKQHGNTGNKHAAKDETQVTQCFRWLPSEKAAVVKYTQAQGIKLSDFIRGAVKEKLGREG